MAQYFFESTQHQAPFYPVPALPLPCSVQPGALPPAAASGQPCCCFPSIPPVLSLQGTESSASLFFPCVLPGCHRLLPLSHRLFCCEKLPHAALSWDWGSGRARGKRSCSQAREAEVCSTKHRVGMGSRGATGPLGLGHYPREGLLSALSIPSLPVRAALRARRVAAPRGERCPQLSAWPPVALPSSEPPPASPRFISNPADLSRMNQNCTSLPGIPPGPRRSAWEQDLAAAGARCRGLCGAAAALHQPEKKQDRELCFHVQPLPC